MNIVFQNGSFDCSRIQDNFGVNVWDYHEISDTILMHHSLFSEFRHNLEFLQSIYSEHSKVKHLGVGSFDYLVGDIVGTAEAYEAMLLEFASDPASASIYYDELKPLLPVLIETMNHGIPIDADFVEASLEWIPQQVAAAQSIAEAYAGYPVSLSSGPQLRVLLDTIEDVFGVAKKLTGITVKKELTEGGEVSLDKDTISALRNSFLAVDFNEVPTEELAIQRIALGAHPLLEAKALYESARILLSNFIKPVLLELTEVDGVLHYDGPMHLGGGAPAEGFAEAYRGKYGVHG